MPTKSGRCRPRGLCLSACFDDEGACHKETENLFEYMKKLFTVFIVGLFMCVLSVSAAEETIPSQTLTAGQSSDGNDDAAGANKKRIALLPLENLTDERDLLKYISPAITYQLEQKGFEVIYGDDLKGFLCEKRVRSDGQVSSEIAGALRDEFDVKAILTGSVLSFSTDDNPQFGILIRLIEASSGVILWADYASATGDDFTTILGLGKIKSIYSLIPKVMDNLFASFHERVLYKTESSSHKVAVLPFQNNSEFKNAGKIAMYLFLVEMLKNQKYEPIEYGNTRNQIINLQIRNRGAMDYESIRALSEPLGAGGVLLGVVDTYSRGLDVASSPQVTITARLIDSGKSRIVWYNTHQLSGEDEVIALDWGRVRSIHKVAHNVVFHMVKEMGMSKWYQ